MKALCLTRLGRGKSEEAAKSLAAGRRVPRDDPPGDGRAAAAAARGRAGARPWRPRRRPAWRSRRPRRCCPAKAVSMDSAPVEIQYALARTALAEGREKDARQALASVVEAGPRRVVTPIPYVRSLALLAALEEKQGRPARGARALRALPQLLEARPDRPRRGGPGRPAPRGPSHPAGCLSQRGARALSLPKVVQGAPVCGHDRLAAMPARAPVHEPKRRLLPWIALAVVWIVWGSTYLGIRVVVHEMPPLFTASFRFLCAGAADGRRGARGRPARAAGPARGSGSTTR